MPVFILTYHRLPAAPRTPRDFYDVPPAALPLHLDALRTRDIAPLDPGQIPDGTTGYLLTFDDGTRDHFDTVLPVLRERGERGIFFIPTAKIGGEGRLTRDDVRALADAGHVIGCHSHDHARLDTLETAGVRAQLATSLGILREITGREALWFAPPGGFTNRVVLNVAAELGLRAVRTMRWGRNETLRPHRLECLPLNHAIPPERFAKILDARGLAWLKALYLGKQMIKALLPMRAYESARATVFRRGS
ncbi:MAG: polysaccharide deacetylase family protein [Chthoniobacteraceae bacterium]